MSTKEPYGRTKCAFSFAHPFDGKDDRFASTEMVSRSHVNDIYFAGWILHDGTVVAEKSECSTSHWRMRYTVSRSSIYILFAEVH